MYSDLQDIFTEKNRKKSVLDQSNSKVWVQFVAKPGQKIPVAKELRCKDDVNNFFNNVKREEMIKEKDKWAKKT